MPKRKKGEVGELDTTEQDKATPKSIVIFRGEVGPKVRALMHEWRNIFLPWSSKSLHGENRSLRDFLAVASLLSVSHLQLFSAPPGGTSLRIMRFSSGPTLSFRVESFMLRDDVLPLQRRPPGLGDAFDTASTVIFNNFSGHQGRPHVAAMEATFRSLFPTIQIQRVKTSDIRRVVLFQYEPSTDVVEVRHYLVVAKAVGLTRTVKKLFEGKVPTKFGTLDKVDDVLGKEGAWSDTDGEGEEVPLATPYRAHKEKCRVKLAELGPRLTLQLVKMESGFAGGEVLYHHHVTKTTEEVLTNARKVRARKAVKLKRRAAQDERVQAKRAAQGERADRKKRRVEGRQGDDDALSIHEDTGYGGDGDEN